jgi:ketosteroid isomerase-like protein
MNRAFCIAAILLAVPMPGFAQQPSSPAAASPAANAAVTEALVRLRAAVLANDPIERAALYRKDAISLSEHQPALYGRPAIRAYHQALKSRVEVLRYDPATSEIFDLDTDLLEYGSFTMAWRTPAGAVEERRGKYANLWTRGDGGKLALKADVWGYFEPLSTPQTFFVVMPQGKPPAWLTASTDRRLAATLNRMNRENAEAVRTRNVEAKLAVFTEDAVIMPFADRPRHGMAEIRPYLTEYTARGEGISFDDVRVWNIGFEDYGDYVVEYSKFHVDWSFPDNRGITKGGGMRLWKRQPDGSLKRHRELGTHDHVQ